MFAFLDLDGVLADFYGSVAKYFGRTNPYGVDLFGDKDILEYWDYTPEYFWNSLPWEFWQTITPMADADAILSLIRKYFSVRDIAVLSGPSPHNSAACLHGKTRWIERNLPWLNRRYVFTVNKYFCAGSDKILIDDFEKNTDEFTAAGGKAFLYPRYWNSRYEEVPQALGLLEQFLETTCQQKVMSE
jgi:hypothetical protein